MFFPKVSNSVGTTIGLFSLLLFTTAVEGQWTFVRGDSNGDGQVQTSDWIYTLAYLFLSGPVECKDALDANDSGGVDIADAVYVLEYLFIAGAPPPAPFAACGADPTLDALDCIGPLPGCRPVFDGPLYPGPQFDVGVFPFSVTVGDVDGDGDLDALTANPDSETMSVLLGNGDGTFAAQAQYGVGAGPFSVTVGDVDGDGDLDALAANSGSDSTTISVLFGNGDGTFAAQAQYGVGANPRSVTVGDVDGDGDLDALTANVDSNTISVLLNRRLSP
ncbi:MAG: FG-GAP-like repeat-containing protein [Planctomycetota bacterium]